MSLVINGTDQGVMALYGSDSDLALDREDAARVQLSSASPGTDSRIHLAKLPDTQVSVDRGSQTVTVTAGANAFASQHLDARPLLKAKPIASETSGFVNYDILGQTSAGSGMKSVGGTIETGASGSFGLVDNTAIASTGGSGLTRLDTTYIFDSPDTMQRMVAGDSITRTGANGTPLRFAGFQFGREFSLQPGFVAFPIPRLQGQATLPSTVDVYVGNALRYQRDVAPGPFTIDQLPVVNGAGETTLVVRDALGRETVTQASFYTTPSLLSEGLWDYSYSGGMLRHDYGTNSFSYGKPFTNGVTRYGVTDDLTMEFEDNIGVDSQTATGDFAFAVPFGGVAQLGGAVSRGVKGTNGGLFAASVSRVSSVFSFSAGIRHAMGGYTAFGDVPDGMRGLWQMDLSGGVSLGENGNFTMSYTRVQRHGMPVTDVAAMTYGLKVGQGYLAVNLASIGGGRRSSSGSVNYTLALDPSTTGTVETSMRESQFTHSVSVATRPENLRGFGGSLTAGTGRQAVDDASATWDGDEGAALAEVSHTLSGTAGRLGMSGGIAFIDGEVDATRHLDNAFALVSVPDHPNVRVYRDNIEVARTDDEGKAIVTDLQPYAANRLKIDITDIPVETTMTGDTLEVVPGLRGGVAAAFDVHTTSNTILSLRLPDGAPVPESADVTAQGMNAPSFTGFDGVVYLVGVQAGADITARWDDKTCHARLPVVQDLKLRNTSPALAVTCVPVSAP